jgi:hypothetical protein
MTNRGTFEPSFIEACKNSKVFNFAFGTKTPMYLKEVHYCPSCHKAVTDTEELSFMEFGGACFTCDHVMGEVLCDGYERLFDESLL